MGCDDIAKYDAEVRAENRMRGGREPEDSLSYPPSDIGTDHTVLGLQAKLADRGYPGLGKDISQADVMASTYAIPPRVVLKLQEQPGVWFEKTSENGAKYEIENIPNEQAMRIIEDVLPKALELYMKKSKDYGGNVMAKIDLGPKACIPDMQRKFGKLVDAIWWGKPLQYEQPEEILMDFIGHILITLDEMRANK